MCYKYKHGAAVLYPRNSLNYVENFLHMMFGTPWRRVQANPVLVRALDRILILHADPRAERSTSTVRLCGFLGRQSVRMHRGRYRMLVGAGHGGANERPQLARRDR
jgi:citrate synthase